MIIEGREYRFATTLLPPANEVWGKVIISKAYASHSIHMGGWGEGGGGGSSPYDITSCLAA